MKMPAKMVAQFSENVLNSEVHTAQFRILTTTDKEEYKFAAKIYNSNDLSTNFSCSERSQNIKLDWQFN